MKMEVIVAIVFGFFTLAGGVIGTYVALIVKITKVDTRLAHVEQDLREEKESNEKYKEETARQFAGIYRAINEVKLLIEKKLK